MPTNVSRNEKSVMVVGICGKSESLCAVTTHDGEELADDLVQAMTFSI